MDQSNKSERCKNIEKLSNDILNALSQKEERNFLAQCRIITEGIFQHLVKSKNIDPTELPTYELGSVIRNNELLKKLNVDIRIKSYVNYIRLMGNRASHYQKYGFKHNEVNAIRDVIGEVVIFFYNSIDCGLPHKINKIISSKRKKKNEEVFEYITDINIFTEALIAIETQEDDYYHQGKNLLSNICSKVIIDTEDYIPRQLYINTKRKMLDLPRSINYIAENKMLPDNVISDMNLANDAFQTAYSAKRYDNADSGSGISKNMINAINRLSDIFLFNRFSKYQDTEIRAVPFLISLAAMLLGMISIISAIFGMIQQKDTGIFISIGSTLFTFFLIAVSIYIIAFSYDLFYSALPSIRNPWVYNTARIINFYGNIAVVAILYFVFYYFLHDGKWDTPYLPFFITTIAWTIILQISNIINNKTKTFHDKFMQITAYAALAFIGFMMIYTYINYN